MSQADRQKATNIIAPYTSVQSGTWGEKLVDDIVETLTAVREEAAVKCDVIAERYRKQADGTSATDFGVLWATLEGKADGAEGCATAIRDTTTGECQL